MVKGFVQAIQDFVQGVFLWGSQMGTVKTLRWHTTKTVKFWALSLTLGVYKIIVLETLVLLFREFKPNRQK